MKKRIYNIIALLAVLVILIGAYAFVMKKNSAKAKTSAKKSSSKAIIIANGDKSKLSKINITSKNGSLEIVKNSAKWTIPQYTFKIDESAVDSMAGELTKFTAQRKLESNADDLSKYGLDKPQATVKLTFSDGTQKEYLLGNTVAGGGYYTMVSGEKSVYTIITSTGNYFLSTINDFGSKTVMTINSSSLAYVKIERSGQQTIEIKKNSDAWSFPQPYASSNGVDDTQMSTLLENVNTIAISKFVDCNPQDLSKYGLDKPKLHITMTDSSNNKAELLFGNDMDSDNTYFKLAGSKEVYAMSKKVSDYFAQLKAFSLTQKYIYMPDISKVDQITITGSGRNDVITMTRSKSGSSSNSSSSNNSSNDTTVYKINGKTIASKTFTQFYQSLTSLEADAENDKQIGTSGDIKMEFRLNTGAVSTVTVNYIPYNDNFYGAVINGKCDFVISKNKVSEVLSKLDKIK